MDSLQKGNFYGPTSVAQTFRAKDLALDGGVRRDGVGYRRVLVLAPTSDIGEPVACLTADDRSEPVGSDYCNRYE
jgi:hypothetical protein